VGPRAGLDTEARGKILLPLPGIEPQSPYLHCSENDNIPSNLDLNMIYSTEKLLFVKFKQSSFIKDHTEGTFYAISCNRTYQQ
jgi:hypothetical protein